MNTLLRPTAQARRHLVDAIETTEGNLMFLPDAGLLQPYNSPVLKSYLDEAKEAAAKGLYYWALGENQQPGRAKAMEGGL